MKLQIRTPHGNEYHVTEKGEITYPDSQPSGEWLMLGIEHVKRSEFIPLAQLTQEKLDSIELLYKNGNPQWTVRDRDHGTVRTWGNTKYHGIKSIVLK